MTTQTEFRYSIVVSFRDDGDVEDMVFGDQETLETFSLDLRRCPDFVVERVVWLKLVPDRHPIKEGGRLTGLKIDSSRGHIYLTTQEKTKLIKSINKEQEDANFTKGRKAVEPNAQPKGRRNNRQT
jgi:hypothetical protein